LDLKKLKLKKKKKKSVTQEFAKMFSKKKKFADSISPVKVPARSYEAAAGSIVLLCLIVWGNYFLPL
jgi:hypothetical protein